MKYYEADIQSLANEKCISWDFANDSATSKRSVFTNRESINFNTFETEISPFLFLL